LSGPPANHAERISGRRVTSLPGQARLILLISLICLTAGAWMLTVYQALSMAAPAAMDMPGMSMAEMPAGLSVAGAIAFVTVWIVMMAAMMLPAAAPMVLTFAQAQARRNPAVFVPTWIFIAGYLLVWLAAGLLVYPIAQLGPGAARPADWAHLALGSTLIVAGLYQFTQLKRLCLRYCRSPLAFVALHWREGRAGALGMGVRHGLYCLGCCWALFAILVAAGVMSLAWMLLLTLLVFAEKVLPLGRRFSTAIGVALVVAGVAISTGILPISWMAT
jgi:predicted metal-binding membrane protein